MLHVALLALAVTTDVHVTGNTHTKTSTILELLPRRPPSVYSDEEVAELERRISNLEIFDSVHVERRAETIEVEVREKWTLIPSVELSTGSSFEDTYALLGLTEYNFLGRADTLGASLYHQQRGWGVDVYFFENTLRRTRWTFGGYLDLSTSEARFDDGSGWTTTAGEAGFFFTSPPAFSDYLSVKVGGSLTREAIADVHGTEGPPDSDSVRSIVGLDFNAFKWNDLVSKGVKGELSFGTGVLVGPTPAQPRHAVELFAVGALPLAKYTVLMARASGSLRTRGNANFGALVGSTRGVRGLEDDLYRNWAQAFGNVELRQSLKLTERWALQGVAFADGAVFEQITPEGDRGDFGHAISVGAGARLVPTWLASIVGRVDVARLLVPDPRWFVQVGLNQYF